MGKAQLVRVAFVRFSPNGKAYPARCDRKDIDEGDEVEVLMRAETDNSYILKGVIHSIEFHRWHCTCRIENLSSEAKYSLTDDFVFERTVTLPSAKIYTIADWKRKKGAYYEGLSHSSNLLGQFPSLRTGKSLSALESRRSNLN